MTTPEIELLHCEFQELEGQGVKLTLTDYEQVYAILEAAREQANDQ